MEAEGFLAKVQQLSDIELALLLCLTASQHCMIQTKKESLDLLEEELQLIAANVFGLSAAVVQCSEEITLEELSNGVLITGHALDDRSAAESSNPNRRSSSYKIEKSLSRDDRKVANIITIKSLNLASHQVQIQVLELLRTGRIFTHTAVHTAPKPFLIVALASVPGPPLVKHLNDHIFLSHYHDPEDGFTNLEEGSEWVEDDRASQSSVVHKSIARQSSQDPLFDTEHIQLLNRSAQSATISVEVKRYLHDIIIFLRRHRAVAGGVTPLATKHFELLARSLAPLHNLDFVTPSLVQLAAKKVYRHRITIVAPESERSLQYGSDLQAVKAILEGVNEESIIYEVLESIEVPL